MEAARGGFEDIVEELAKRGPNCDLNMRTVSFSPGPFPDFQCCMCILEMGLHGDKAIRTAQIFFYVILPFRCVYTGCW